MKIKAATLALCGLALGFVSARWIPGVSGPEASVVPSARALNPRHTPPAVPEVPKKSARSLDLEGDWRTEAKTWAKEDPAGLRDWLVEGGVPPDRELLAVLFREWAARDPDAAFEAYFNLPRDFAEEKFLLSTMLNQALKTPAGLSSVLKWAPRAEEQMSSWFSPNEAWLKGVDPRQLAAQFEEAAQNKNSGGGYTGTLLEALAKHWAATDTEAALKWVHSLPPGGMRVSAAAGVLSAWTARDPKAVLDYLAGEATSSERWNAFAPLSKIAESDPRAAMDWLEKNRGISDSNSIRQIYWQWCKTDEAGAVEYAMEIDDPILRRDCLQAWGSAAKPESIWTAFNETTDSENRSILLMEMARNFRDDGGTGDNAIRFRQLISEGKIPEITPEIAASATWALAYSSPRQAMEWAASLPAPIQSASVNSAVQAWAAKDRVAAAQAVENLPDGPVKKAAVKILKGDVDPFDAH